MSRLAGLFTGTLWGLLAGALALAGCAPSEAERDWPAPSPALWAVSGPAGEPGNGVAPVAWLFGTIHALPGALEWRTPALTASLARSGVLVVEVAELGDSAAAAEAFALRSRSPGLPPLLERVPATDRPALAAALESAGLSERAFAGVESWAAALQLANGLRRYDSANGVDRELIGDARRVIGLESFDRQFALFDALPPEAQGHLLVAVAREATAEQDERIAAWLTGDISALVSFGEDGLLADPVLREALLLTRNRAWAERIAALIEAGERPFVAVGAAHMPGPEGLPALFAARGYAVRRVQ